MIESVRGIQDEGKLLYKKGSFLNDILTYNSKKKGKTGCILLPQGRKLALPAISFNVYFLK